MSELILSQLKSKPKPSTREENMILVKLEKKDPALKDTPVALNIPIKNKVEESLIDRSKILEKIKPVPSNLTKTETKTETKSETKSERDKLIRSDAKTESEKTAITKIKKTKKLKLVTIDGDTDKLPDKPRETKKPTEEIISGPKSLLDIKEITDKLPDADEKIIIKAPVYYQNNREIFINFINGLFDPYKKEIEENLENYSCDKSNDADFQLLFHQKIVRDYLNLYTPYRGLLLYHGLGSGKTCSSIAIAEGFKSEKQIFVMTPASLRINYIEELKKCGDLMYRKTQYWEFVNIKDKPELIEPLSSTLNLTTKFIKDNNVVWFVNIKEKKSNYNLLNVEEKNSLDKQLDEMIKNKFKFINYNGIRNSHLNALTLNNTINPFSNSVIIIDEAHNFVSRIVNQINNKRKGRMYLLYDLIMKANNAKIVLLTGTPIINYPSEIGVLYNLLRGYITTWSIPIEWDKKEKMDANKLLTIFDEGKLKTHDVVEYSNNKIQITRNPFGFVNTKKRGVVKGTKKIKVGGKNKTHKYGEPKMNFEEEEITEEEKELMLRNMEN